MSIKSRLQKSREAKNFGFSNVEDSSCDLLKFFKEHTELDTMTVYSHEEIYGEVNGNSSKLFISFVSKEEYLEEVDKILKTYNRSFEASHITINPSKNTAVNVFLPPLAQNEPILYFSRQKIQNQNTVCTNKLISSEITEYFKNSLDLRANIFITGDASVNKAQIMNLLAELQEDNKKLIICGQNDGMTVNKPCAARFSKDFLKSFININYDNIFCNNAESEDLLNIFKQIISGYNGFVVSFSVKNDIDMMSAIRNMILLSNTNLFEENADFMTTSSMDVIVQTEKTKNGNTRIVKVSETSKNKAGEIALKDIFVWSERANNHLSTGNISKYIDAECTEQLYQHSYDGEYLPLINQSNQNDNENDNEIPETISVPFLTQEELIERFVGKKPQQEIQEAKEVEEPQEFQLVQKTQNVEASTVLTEQTAPVSQPVFTTATVPAEEPKKSKADKLREKIKQFKAERQKQEQEKIEQEKQIAQMTVQAAQIQQAQQAEILIQPQKTIQPEQIQQVEQVVVQEIAEKETVETVTEEPIVQFEAYTNPVEQPQFLSPESALPAGTLEINNETAYEVEATQAFEPVFVREETNLTAPVEQNTEIITENDFSNEEPVEEEKVQNVIVEEEPQIQQNIEEAQIIIPAEEEETSEITEVEEDEENKEVEETIIEAETSLTETALEDEYTGRIDVEQIDLVDEAEETEEFANQGVLASESDDFSAEYTVPQNKIRNILEEDDSEEEISQTASNINANYSSVTEKYEEEFPEEEKKPIDPDLFGEIKDVDVDNFEVADIPDEDI